MTEPAAKAGLTGIAIIIMAMITIAVKNLLESEEKIVLRIIFPFVKKSMFVFYSSPLNSFWIISYNVLNKFQRRVIHFRCQRKKKVIFHKQSLTIDSDKRIIVKPSKSLLQNGLCRKPDLPI